MIRIVYSHTHACTGRKKQSVMSNTRSSWPSWKLWKRNYVRSSPSCTVTVASQHQYPQFPNQARLYLHSNNSMNVDERGNRALTLEWNLHQAEKGHEQARAAGTDAQVAIWSSNLRQNYVSMHVQWMLNVHEMLEMRNESHAWIITFKSLPNYIISSACIVPLSILPLDQQMGANNDYAKLSRWSLVE